MYVLFTAIAVFFTLSCGAIDHANDVIHKRSLFLPKHAKPYVDPQFRPYYDKFNKDYNVNVYHISIFFEDIKNSTTAGICTKYANGRREITIDRDLWNTFDVYKREVLVYHELGHCYFNRPHSVETFYSDKFGNIPKSIMNAHILSSAWYEHHQHHYVDELGE